MNITKKDLIQLQFRAKVYWAEIPLEAKLPGETNELTASERLAVSWLEACMELLKNKGTIAQQEVTLEFAHSEPDAEY